MPRNDASLSPLLLAVVVGGILCAAPWAKAKDAGAPAPKKIDQPFLASLLGTWNWTSRTPGGTEEKGTETFRLALLDTAVFDEIDGVAGGSPFQGHGVLELGADGATVSGWWFFSPRPGALAFHGTLTADGYEVKSDEGERMQLRRTDGGLEMKAFKGETPTRTVTYTKR